MGGGIVSSVPLAFVFPYVIDARPLNVDLFFYFSLPSLDQPLPPMLLHPFTSQLPLVRIIISPPSRSARNVATTALSLLVKVQYVPQKGQGVEVHPLPLLLLI